MRDFRAGVTLREPESLSWCLPCSARRRPLRWSVLNRIVCALATPFPGNCPDFRGGKGWGGLETPFSPRTWDGPLRPRQTGPLFGRLPLAVGKAKGAEP